MDPGQTYRRLVPVDHLASRVTPTDDVYVIAHMGIARVDVAAWRLRVDGLVERPLELDYAMLTQLPATEVTAVLECFGNPVEPDVATRRVGNVVWRGVRLGELLERAGVSAEARYVCPEGLDSGTFAGVHSERYVKDLPLARALDADVLVAWAMNGAPLSPEHGFPARVFVPGYFGTNAVKWLCRLTLAAERPESLFTTRLYNRRVDGESRPVRELDVHAVIVAPADGATLRPGRHTITGWAWSAWPVRAVEVSTDDGARWQDAEVTPRGADHQWQRFTYAWNVATPGRYAVHARAADARGRVQPAAGRNRTHSISVAVA
ncbi:MAG TPA: molybdopterin-dependent oxidoreductase [Methylomirabilota bacterium]|jgi:DMSO/TMAO reductase YedYZ molybdopterin-dependent catalytic subunit|nr:molybdopterin-dependent oxidoreductase [Methylomirabilota bacterium]